MNLDGVRASFDRQSFMATLGAELVHVGNGVAEIAVDHDDKLTQQHGYLHAGVLASIVDSACGYAALTTMDEDSAVLTAEFKLNLLAPARSGRFVARGEVVKAGRTLTVARGEVRSGDELVAIATVTLVAVRGRRLSG